METLLYSQIYRNGIIVGSDIKLSMVFYYFRYWEDFVGKKICGRRWNKIESYAYVHTHCIKPYWSLLDYGRGGALRSLNFLANFDGKIAKYLKGAWDIIYEHSPTFLKNLNLNSFNLPHTKSHQIIIQKQ